MVPSTEPDPIEWARAEQGRADQVLRRVGQDVETQLRVDRSVASGINRTPFRKLPNGPLLPIRAYCCPMF